MVEVFKTNVKKAGESKRLAKALQEHMPGSSIYFDLGDCDKVLRIEHTAVPCDQVILVLSGQGYHCEVMP